MSRYAYLFAAPCLAAALFFGPRAAGAAEPPRAEAADNPADKAGPGADVAAGLQADAVPDDPAFDRYVDLRLAGRAWAGRDAALLADVALQLAEGERVVLRTHKSGITSEQLLGMAARLAADQKDKATLERLAKAADARGDKALTAQVGAARKLADQARAVNPAVQVSVETTTPEQFAVYSGLLNDIRGARLAGDADMLRAVEQEIPNAPGLAPEQRDYLNGLLKEARDAAPPGGSEQAKLGRTLDKLALASRGPFDSLSDNLSNLDPFKGGSATNQALNNFDQQRLQAMSQSPRPGRDYTKLFIKNGTDRRISVALRVDTYSPPDNGNTSHLSSGNGGTTPFDTYAWYNLNPGQEQFIANTANINVYFYAEGGGRFWRGDHRVTVYDGGKQRNLGMLHEFIVAPTNESWTINITK